jgi:DNA-binding CsgD family transcriptional regulator
LRAWRGDAEGVRAAADSLPGPPGGAALGGVQVQVVRTGLAVLALGSGRYVDALAAARRVFDDDPPYWGHLVLPDLVEAGVRGGDHAVAEAAVRRFADRVGASRTGWAPGLLARSRALLAEDADAESLYQEAVHHLAGTRVTTELARAHLLYGEWLRRRRRRADARRELDAAHGMFTAMGAAAFAERSRGELVAAGMTGRRRGPRAAEDLTAHEARIAHLAGGGATNQQIATELFISPNTVDYHLRKVFRKLGVTSRHQLEPAAIDG